jgi:hypothetical protein
MVLPAMDHSTVNQGGRNMVDNKDFHAGRDKENNKKDRSARYWASGREGV